MQQVAVFIVIILAVIGLTFFGKTQETAEEGTTQTKETVSQETIPTKSQTYLKSAPELPESESPISVYTYITSGPKDGEIINDTNEVTFEFEGRVLPEETDGRITFETKVEGFDEDWKKTSSQKRKITLPAGPREYTFFVRAKINDVVDQTPAKRTFKINVSSYFEKITISSVRAKTSSRDSSITLTTHLKKGEEINITGWQIVGKKGSFLIPQGIEKYHPIYNQEPNEDILIKYGDKIYLSGALNPLGRDRNFRPNKCIGYLENYYDFPISLSKDCPKPSDEEISHLDLCCQEFIDDLRRCEAPDYSDNIKVSGDAQCTSYLTKTFNYDACFQKYSRDSDFLDNQWHIYMGHDLISESRDTLYLKDKQGLIVDKYTYGCLICD
jgi:hypothetical protein